MLIIEPPQLGNFFFKKWPFQTSFSLFLSFQYSWQQTMFNINFADGRIWTADLWCRMQLLCKLSHNHYKFVEMQAPNAAPKVLQLFIGSWHAANSVTIVAPWISWIELMFSAVFLMPSQTLVALVVFLKPSQTLVAFTGVANPLEPSPQPTACRPPRFSLSTTAGSNLAKG